jgi:uncharacterized membrane protein
VPDYVLHSAHIEVLDLAMPQPMVFRIRGLGLRGWLMILVSVSLALAIVVAIAVVAVGVFLFLLPLLAVSATLYYLFGRRRFRAQYRQDKGPVIIDGEFHVVDASEIERTPPPQN